MDLKTFENRFVAAMPVGAVVDNPGKGTSTVVRYDDGRDGDEVRVTYRRGGVNFGVRLGDLHAAYLAHGGRRVATRDLKAYRPEVFGSDSGAKVTGHGCNCTFLFCALQRMGLAGELLGRGVRGDPFAVEFLPATQTA